MGGGGGGGDGDGASGGRVSDGGRGEGDGAGGSEGRAGAGVGGASNFARNPFLPRLILINNSFALMSREDSGPGPEMVLRRRVCVCAGGEFWEFEYEGGGF